MSLAAFPWPDRPPPGAEAGDSLEPAAIGVEALLRQLANAVEPLFPAVWVEGEISNFSRSGAGHCYWTLKDGNAQIRAVMWRGQAAGLPFAPADGLRVLAQGAVEVYAARGQCQLQVRRLLPRGVGPWELALRQRRERLAAAGLFDPARKRPLPRFPQRVALVASLQGAAVRDFLETARRRWPAARILVVPAAAQGDHAPAQLRAALALAGRLPVQAVALVRGGGSFEDLWAYQDEDLARAVAACPWPVATGIGHEIDISLCDLVADVHALTPTDAAMRLFPDRHAAAAQLAQASDRLALACRRQLQRAGWRLDQLAAAPPFRRPLARVEASARQLDEAEARLNAAAARRLELAHAAVDRQAAALAAAAPQALLARGYVAVEDAAGRPVRHAAAISPGSRLTLRFADGAWAVRAEEPVDAG